MEDKNEKSTSSKNKTKFLELYRKYYIDKPYPFCDFRETEVKIAGFLTVFFFGLMCVYVFSSPAEAITESVKLIVSGIAFAMIGLLGFIITGLSVLLGTTSKSFFVILIRNGLEIEFEKILFSFYYLGFFVGVVIIFSIFSFFLMSLELPVIFPVFIVLACIYFYLVTFVIFYAISLLGVCFIFFITKLKVEVSAQIEDDMKLEIEKIFQRVKIEALSEVVFKEGKAEEFFIAIKRLVDSDFYEYKNELRQKIIDYYQLDEEKIY